MVVVQPSFEAGGTGAAESATAERKAHQAEADTLRAHAEDDRARNEITADFLHSSDVLADLTK